MMLKKIIPIDDLKKTVRRFPLSAVCSAFLFLLIVLSSHDMIKIEDHADLFGRLMVLSAYGFFWFGLARLIAEGKGLAPAKEYALGFTVFAVLAGFVFLTKGFTLAWLLTLMIPALLLGISIGPYLNSKDDLSLWFYNRQVWQGAAIAILAGLIWGGGISAALASIDYLFGVDIDGKFYSDLWVFTMIIFTPIYALSWVPEEYSYTEEDCHTPPQLSFLLNWVLAPLVIIYMLILYAYFIKIALAGELPRGQLSYMVTAFGGVGVLTYLAGWPLRETGGPLLKPIYKLFFPALFIPVAMQALSIYERIDQYGLTEQRYVIVISTIWFAFLAVVYTFKKPPLKYMQAVLAVMLMVAAIGPLSAPNMAEYSQMARLEALLVNNRILVDGKIVKVTERLPYADRGEISSILDFLEHRKKLDRLAPWLGGNVPRNEDGEISITDRAVTERMGFEFVYDYKPERKSEGFYLNVYEQRNVRDVDGYRFLVGPQYVSVSEKKCDPCKHRLWELAENKYPEVAAYYEGGQLFVGLPGKGAVGFDVLDFAVSEYKKDKNLNRKQLGMEKSENGVRVRLFFRNISLYQDVDAEGQEPPYHLNNFTFEALIGDAP